MKYENEKINLEEGLEKEWIITNGVGGYASSTIVGTNTRKYHGLLVAALKEPAKRTLILSKLDESLHVNGKDFNLYTNMCKNYISNGYKHLIDFNKEYIPIFSYKIENVFIKKFICMEHGKNAVTVFYHIKNGNNMSKLKIAPVVNFKDFHHTEQKDKFDIEQTIENNKVKLVIENNIETPVYMNLSEGTYEKYDNNIFHNMFYLEEEKRFQGSLDNHIVPGCYEIKLLPYEEKTFTFVCSLEENIENTVGFEIINKEIMRISEVIYDSELIKEENSDSKNEMLKNLIISTDNFVVNRPSFGLHTIIAGYPWFLDWGRDTLIAFEGLLLKTRRFDIAKEVLLTMVKDVKFGLVPNGYAELDNTPLYNSADASLLLFEQVKKFLKYTSEYTWVKENLYDILKNIIKSYSEGIYIDNNNIYLDEDGLISSGNIYTQNTWMDAKIGDVVVTPRNGKAVEINALWFNALKVMEELTIPFKEKELGVKYIELAKKCKISFEEKFYNKKRKCLFDVVGNNKIRPNQLFALSLSYPVIDPASNIAKEIIEVVDKKLLTNYGLRTLAKTDEDYIGRYEGDMVKRDMSYHQGTIWPWLLGLYFDSLNNMIKCSKDKEEFKELKLKKDNFVKQVEETFDKEMKENSTVGNIHEIYVQDNKKYIPEGAYAQAWSVSEILRIICDK